MKNRILVFFTLLYFFSNITAQTGWTWQELTPMPEKVSNNAVVEGFIGNDAFVYSLQE